LKDYRKACAEFVVSEKPTIIHKGTVDREKKLPGMMQADTLQENSLTLSEHDHKVDLITILDWFNSSFGYALA